jgi:hypothetical protein
MIRKVKGRLPMDTTSDSLCGEVGGHCAKARSSAGATPTSFRMAEGQ